MGFNELAYCRQGLMLFNRHDRFIGASLRTYGEYARSESALFEQLVEPGMIVVEAGANIGTHTVGLSGLVGPSGRVLAFEPQRLIFQTLCANLALNSCQNVYVRQEALGSTLGEMVVPQLAPDQANNFGGVSLIDGHPGERVPLRTLDSFNLTACHLFKLDVEGMEADALRGAETTIGRHRPVLYFEADRVDKFRELLKLVMGYGYRLYPHLSPLFNANNFAQQSENIFGGLGSINVLATPSERDIHVDDASEIVDIEVFWQDFVKPSL